MARKDSTPKPPNHTGQQQRSTTQLGDGGQRRILYLIGATGLAALAIVVAVLVLGGGDTDEQTALCPACAQEEFG